MLQFPSILFKGQHDQGTDSEQNIDTSKCDCTSLFFFGEMKYLHPRRVWHFVRSVRFIKVHLKLRVAISQYFI